jgi:hypothetical protein
MSSGWSFVVLSKRQTDINYQARAFQEHGYIAQITQAELLDDGQIEIARVLASCAGSVA